VHEDIIQAIDIERAYQDKRWGTIQMRPHTVGEWLLIMQGELDEAIQAWQKGTTDTAALEEILQVVTVGVACMEQHGLWHQQQHLDAPAV
jgi:NTP pyrophosphatase (non-canonical NTP hydrolase)